MGDVIINVRGEHENRIPPEEGTVHVTVSAQGHDRGAVVEELAARVKPVREDLDKRDASGEVTRVVTQHARVWSETRRNRDGAPLAPIHHAATHMSATFTDFAALSWWVTTMAEQEGVAITHIHWSLTPEMKKATEAKVAALAVTEAVDRATAYAQALGLTTVEPVQISDVGLSTDQGWEPQRMMVAPAGAARSGAEPMVDFQPEDVVVSSAVEARFSAR